MGELVFLGVLLAIGGYYFAETFTYPVNMYERSGGPGLFPRMVLIIFAVFVVIRIIQILFAKGKPHFVFIEVFKGPTGVFFFSILAYLLLMKPLGYLISTLLFGIFLVNYLHIKRLGSLGSKKEILIRTMIVVAVTVALYFFFYKFLHVNLPVGIMRLPF